MNNTINQQIVRILQTDSTNNYANRQIRENVLPEGTVFLAYEQTSGRGQFDNVWESEPGANLLFSMVLYPDFLAITRQFMLSKIVSLGIYSVVHKLVEGAKIKWPNDIYVGDKKLGGILIENSIMSGTIKSSIVGVGLNINQTDFKSNAPNPVSLKMLTNKHCESEGILQDILAEISRYYDLLCLGNFEKIDKEFLSALYRLNERHYFKSNVIFEGEIVGVDPIGKLLIKKDDGLISEFYFKEVEFLQKQ